MEILSTLHPAVACTLIITEGAVSWVFIWSFWKTLRG